MKIPTILSVVALTGLMAFPANAQNETAQPSAAVPLKSTRDQASYAIGLNIGRDLKSNGLDINVAALVKGLQDVITGQEQSLSNEQCQAALVAFQREIQAKMAEKRRAAAGVNKKNGETFLAANKSKEGVKSLESGLQYQVLKSGDGPSPKVSDTVKTHYHGTLLDGTVFDSSVQRNEPAVFPVGGVIRGWTEALQLMSVGDKWRLFVPSELAYGERGAGDVIGPNAVLIFDVELLGIE